MCWPERMKARQPSTCSLRALLRLLGEAPVKEVRAGAVTARVLAVGTDLLDGAGTLTERYDGRPGTVYLFRPDQHVAARWRRFDAKKIEAAIARCLQA